MMGPNSLIGFQKKYFNRMVRYFFILTTDGRGEVLPNKPIKIMF